MLPKANPSYPLWHGPSGRLDSPAQTSCQDLQRCNSREPNSTKTNPKYPLSHAASGRSVSPSRTSEELLRCGSRESRSGVAASPSRVSYEMPAAVTAVRHLVSGNRSRYVDSEYDLDLTYITRRLIAMAFPGEDMLGPFSSIIRNDLRSVLANIS